MEEKKDLVNLENMDIEPLTDDDLDTVAGGSNCSCCESHSCCTGGGGDERETMA